MKSIFNPEGPVVRFLGYIAELMALNLCFLLCSIPVFTVGTSITALYGALFLREGGGAFRRFFREFRRNFRQGTLLGLILGAAGVILVLDYQLLGQMEGYALVKYILYLAGLCWLGVAATAFGLTARYEDKLGRTLKNALLLSFSALSRTVLIVVIDALPLLLLLLAPDLFGRSFILWLLLGFALCAQLKVWVLKDIFSLIPGQAAPQDSGSTGRLK